MKIKWRIHIAGAVEGHEEGAHPGDIWDVPDANGARYCHFRYADPVVERKVVEHAVAPKVEERAVVAPPPPPEPEPAPPVSAPANVPFKRGPGRPAKTA